MQRHHYTAAGFLLMVLLVSVIAGIEFSAMYEPDTFTPSEGVTRIGKLSDYFDGIKGTSGDVDVYFFESENPGATALLLGGTHPNESSGFITAAVMLENVSVSAGRLIVVPQACGSGFTSTDPLEGCPQHFTVTTQSGERTFRYGARGGNPLDEWPAPLIYRHFPSGQQLSNKESRNLNRAYPGRADGSFTEQVGHAFMQLIRKENVDIGFDLHEAAPEIPIINAIVTHEKGKEIAATAVFSLEIEDLQYSLEISPKNFRGLSHREWGDSSNAYPFLMETSNPIQGRLRGETSEQLILDGNDKFYREAAQLGNVRITYDLNGETLSRRVARHLQGIRRLVEAYNEQFPENPVIIENMPEYEEVITGGVGKFLR